MPWQLLLSPSHLFPFCLIFHFLFFFVPFLSSFDFTACTQKPPPPRHFHTRELILFYSHFYSSRPTAPSEPSLYITNIFGSPSPLYTTHQLAPPPVHRHYHHGSHIHHTIVHLRHKDPPLGRPETNPRCSHAFPSSSRALPLFSGIFLPR